LNNDGVSESLSSTTGEGEGSEGGDNSEVGENNQSAAVANIANTTQIINESMNDTQSAQKVNQLRRIFNQQNSKISEANRKQKRAERQAERQAKKAEKQANKNQTIMEKANNENNKTEAFNTTITGTLVGGGTVEEEKTPE
jgi:hypothetical protein